jgi:peptide/nickel transport system ATP-binding protein
MYLGKIVEEAPAAELYRTPLHPYTRVLMASTPSAKPGAPTPPAVTGEMPSPVDPPSGCTFHPRCPVAEPECSRLAPRLLKNESGHKVACHLARPTGSADPPEQ